MKATLKNANQAVSIAVETAVNRLKQEGIKVGVERKESIFTDIKTGKRTIKGIDVYLINENACFKIFVYEIDNKDKKPLYFSFRDMLEKGRHYIESVQELNEVESAVLGVIDSYLKGDKNDA
jgi:hypothetical protein